MTELPRAVPVRLPVFLVVLVGLVVGGHLGAMGAAGAAGDEWREERTEHFIVLCRAGDEPQAEAVRLSIEEIYGDLRSAFGAQLDHPITVRLYPSVDEYLAANPLAVEVDGVLAQSHRGRREIGIALRPDPAAGGRSSENDVRYGIGHLFIYRLSDGRMPSGLQEGLASYLLRPEEGQAGGVARLREAWRRDSLFTWSDIAGPGSEYLDPPLSYPQALSIYHFLVEQRGFPAVVDFVRAVAAEPSWREAMEVAFDTTADDLESLWQAWLPAYLDGGWRFHALYARDLSTARALIDAGNHESAIAHLTSALALLTVDDPELAAEARELLDVAEAAGRGRALLDEARELLSAAEYQAAAHAAAESLAQLAQNDDQVQIAEEVLERARLGVEARSSLESAANLPPWRVTEARSLADEAAAAFTKLGNVVEAARAREVRAHLDSRQAPAGWAMLLLGTTLLVRNVHRRRRDKLKQGPLK